MRELGYRKGFIENSKIFCGILFPTIPDTQTVSVPPTFNGNLADLLHHGSKMSKYIYARSGYFIINTCILLIVFVSCPLLPVIIKTTNRGFNLRELFAINFINLFKT